MKVFYKKQKLTIIRPHSYKNFSNHVFTADIHNKISQVTFKKNELEFHLFKTVLKEAI